MTASASAPSADRYVSTRGDTTPTDFTGALLRGMAPDGGLYMPAAWPTLPSDVARPGRPASDSRTGAGGRAQAEPAGAMAAAFAKLKR